MRLTFLAGILVLAGAIAGTALRADDRDPSGWNPKAAASYLDGRASWWTTWQNAARDHDTFCVSCHTTATYILARPALRRPLNETAVSATEAKLADNVAKRVSLWREVAPFYPDQTNGLPKTSESRGTEAVLNALTLAVRDAEAKRLSPELQTAFANMWALQMKRQDLAGAWAWLNFHYEPWESNDGSYFGASMAALAVGIAPGYAESADIQENLKLLRAYVQKAFDKQPLFNQAMALWASSRLKDLLTAEQRKLVVDAVLSKQQEDGGWSMATLGSWKRTDNTAIETRSDGYATGLVAVALQSSGMPASNSRVAKGLDWLRRNQDPATGQWTATSLNKQRDPASDAGKFMSDAATAYAVLALTR